MKNEIGKPNKLHEIFEHEFILDNIFSKSSSVLMFGIAHESEIMCIWIKKWKPAIRVLIKKFKAIIFIVMFFENFAKLKGKNNKIKIKGTRCILQSVQGIMFQIYSYKKDKIKAIHAKTQQKIRLIFNWFLKLSEFCQII